MGAISRVYPEPFLEKQLFGFDLDSLLHELNVASTQGSTAGNVLYVVDIVIPVLSKSVTSCVIGMHCSYQYLYIHIFVCPLSQVYMTYYTGSLESIDNPLTVYSSYHVHTHICAHRSSTTALPTMLCGLMDLCTTC